MAFFDSYKSINRGGITKDSKAATRQALAAALADEKRKPHAIQIVKALLDFKAHQSVDGSAERLLGNLANHIGVCNQAKDKGVEDLTERSLHELVRNRSAIFKKDLPDTFKQVLNDFKTQADAWSVLVDTNTARILRSNGLITEAELRAAKPASRVAEQILPGELAAFLNRSEEMQGAAKRTSTSWPLAEFLKQCTVDTVRNDSDMEKRAIVHLIVLVSKGVLGGQKFYEQQREAKEVRMPPTNRDFFKRKIGNKMDPQKGSETSPYLAATLHEGGQGAMYKDFLSQAGHSKIELQGYTGFKEAMESLDVRQKSLETPRISQHLTVDTSFKNDQYKLRPTIMSSTDTSRLKSNPQHQQWLDLREATAAAAKKMKLVDAEAIRTTRAIMVCGAAVQTCLSLAAPVRTPRSDGAMDLNDDETRLRDRVAACLAKMALEDQVGTPQNKAEGMLCGVAGVKATTTLVETQAQIVHQEWVKKFEIPGETFYLHQKRQLKFYWDEKANFIQADLVYHSPWTCSTTDPKPIEDAAL